MEQILEKILQKLDSLENGQKQLEAGQKQLDEKIDGVQDEMRTGYRALENKINGVQDEMRTGYRTLEEKINGVRAEVDRQTLNIGVIAERHGEIIEHLKAFSDYRTTKGRIADLEVTSKDHTRRLERIENQAV